MDASTLSVNRETCNNVGQQWYPLTTITFIGEYLDIVPSML